MLHFQRQTKMYLRAACEAMLRACYYSGLNLNDAACCSSLFFSFSFGSASELRANWIDGAWSLWAQSRTQLQLQFQRCPSPGRHSTLSAYGFQAPLACCLHTHIHSGSLVIEHLIRRTTQHTYKTPPPIPKPRFFLLFCFFFGHAVAVIVAHNFNSWTLMNRHSAFLAGSFERFLAVTFTRRPIRRFISLRLNECELAIYVCVHVCVIVCSLACSRVCVSVRV